MPKFTRSHVLYAAFVALACAIVMGVASFQYSNYVDRKNKHQWCTIVETLDDTYTANPPQTAAGKRLAGEFARMRKEFHCKPKEVQ